MLSTSLETQVRGDEGQRCGQLSQYRSAVRVPRDTEDVEMMKTPEMANVRKRLHQKFGRYQNEDEDIVEEEPKDEENEDATEGVDGEETELEQQTGSIDGASNAISACPVENGVLRSQWGAVAGGTVIAGIAAGLVQQQVTVRDLVADENRFGQLRQQPHKFQRQTSPTNVVDNRFAATLSGDIAEAVIRQVMFPAIQVGAAGAWNNSAVPRWYFLSQRERLEMTDAEIRGGIDGLTIALSINEWRNRQQSIRLSQILDMYYSQRGVFGMTNAETSIRACNRRNNFPRVAPIATLSQQSFAFTVALDLEMPSEATLSPNATARLAEQGTNALHTYISELAWIFFFDHRFWNPLPLFQLEPSTTPSAKSRPPSPTMTQSGERQRIFTSLLIQHGSTGTSIRCSGKRRVQEAEVKT